MRKYLETFSRPLFSKAGEVFSDEESSDDEDA
jgi:hypothetical protein